MNKETIATADAKIRGWLQEIMATGAVDHERDTIDGILKQLQNGKLKPEEAIRQAWDILVARQDYH